MIEWKIHSYNRDVITYFFNFVFAFKRNNIFVPSLNISHTRRTLRIFFQFTKTYRTTGSQTRNCEKLVEICIARHMPGLTRPWTFARDDDRLPLSPPSFIRASSFRSWDPFLRERFVIVYRIVYPIHGTLSPPGPFLETLCGGSRCAKGVEALGAPLSASKFMNRRLRSPRRGRSNPKPND